MPVSRTNPKRKTKARKYAANDAHYQRVLKWWEADMALSPETHRNNKPTKRWLRYAKPAYKV